MPKPHRKFHNLHSTLTKMALHCNFGCLGSALLVGMSIVHSILADGFMIFAINECGRVRYIRYSSWIGSLYQYLYVALKWRTLVFFHMDLHQCHNTRHLHLSLYNTTHQWDNFEESQDPHVLADPLSQHMLFWDNCEHYAIGFYTSFDDWTILASPHIQDKHSFDEWIDTVPAGHLDYD